MYPYIGDSLCTDKSKASYKYHNTNYRKTFDSIMLKLEPCYHVPLSKTFLRFRLYSEQKEPLFSLECGRSLLGKEGYRLRTRVTHHPKKILTLTNTAFSYFHQLISIMITYVQQVIYGLCQICS